MYPDVRLEMIQGCIDTTGASLWLEPLLWASECFSRAATSVNDEGLSPHENLHESHPPLQMLPRSMSAEDQPPGSHVLFLKPRLQPRAGLLQMLAEEMGRVV